MRAVILAGLVGCFFSCNVPGPQADPHREQMKSLGMTGEDDKLVIQYHTHGCFHNYKQTLLVSANREAFSIDLAEMSYDSLVYRLDAAGPLLPDSAIQAFRKFRAYGEESQKNPTLSFCTTVSEYELIHGGDTLKFEDGNCEFEDYHILLKSIFGKERLKIFYDKVR